MSGIDLGMTNSVMAITEADEPTVLENRAGARLTPSIVAQRGEGLGEILVGQRAKSQGGLNPKNTISSIKRLMGCRYEDPEVQRAVMTAS